jgi:hypothetical protein
MYHLQHAAKYINEGWPDYNLTLVTGYPSSSLFVYLHVFLPFVAASVAKNAT